MYNYDFIMYNFYNFITFNLKWEKFVLDTFSLDSGRIDHGTFYLCLRWTVQCGTGTAEHEKRFRFEI